jgi:hypothetical protein
MSEARPPRRTGGLPRPQRLSAARLFTVVIVFLLLAGYAVWKSERFQNLLQGVSRERLSAALGVPVSFDTVELRFFPPSISLANVRIGNDPALGLPADTPLLTAEQIGIGGGISLTGGELRLGRLRAVRPSLSLVQLADGRWNLPPGLKRSSSRNGRVKVVVASLLVQQGSLAVEGRKLSLDAKLEDFTAELVSAGPDRYRGGLVCRTGSVRVSGSETIRVALDARFLFDARRGVTIDRILAEGDFGTLRANGALEENGRPGARLSVAGTVSIEEAERLFHAKLGFAGQAEIRARIEVPPGGAYRVTGTLHAPAVRAERFRLEDVAARVVANPSELVARIERARYAGGTAHGSFRVASLRRAPRPMTLLLEAEGLSLESFFSDIQLPGTGLSGAADLSLALRWGESGLTHANGGGTLSIEPGRAVSAVRGRYGIPTGGGGALAVVDGRIGFEAFAVRFPQSTVEFTGGVRIGRWQPDFDFRLRSRDLIEVDRLFNNFLAATGGRAEPLGLGGSGEAQGHLEGTWGDPRATARLAIEDARYAGVRFGSARGTVDLENGAFLFRPLRVYEGDGALSLEGAAAFREVRGRPKFDLVVSARRYPLARLLDYLDLDYPVEGLVTGVFPLRGSPEALTGGGAVELADAVLWGQPLPRVSGRVVFSPGRFGLEEVRAPLGGGMVGGSGSLALREKTFTARLAGDGIALDSLRALERARDFAGRLSFQLSGSGRLDRPDLDVTATVADARLFGHPIPGGLEPGLTAKVEAGVLRGELAVPKRWSVTAEGDLFGGGAPLAIAVNAPDLASLLLFTPIELPPDRNGALALEGSLSLPARPGEGPSGTFRVTRARLDLPERPGVLATSGEVRVALAGGRLTFDEFELKGEGTSLRVRGLVDVGAKSALDVSVAGGVDAALLAIFVPQAGLTGRLDVQLAATGSLSRPSLSGTVRVEDGRYRLAGAAQLVDEIDATLRFGGSRGELEARARFGGGEVFAAGSFEFAGTTIQSFRLTAQGRRVTVRYPQDMRLLVDADLVATGDADGNVVRGEVVLLRGTYSRDFDVTISDFLARSRPATAVVAVDRWRQETRLEVHIVSSAALEVRNNLARLTGTVDLMARGTVADPSLIGQIVLDEGGRLTFRDVRYEIESGTITFANARGFVPIVDVRARAEVRGYDLVVTLAGAWPRLQTTFTSDPPLPDETIVALLLTGAEPGAAPTDASTSIVTAAGSLVGGAATSAITRPAARLFKLERFQIDPVFTGTGFSGATTTVGKQISPNWSVTYSQPLFEAGTREPVVQIEGRISQSWIVRMRRDENGIYLVDLRRRQRY